MSTNECRHCGQVLHAPTNTGETAVCPRCRGEAQGSLTSPHRLASAVMPWAASAMLHLGVFLIVLLIVAISGPVVVATTSFDGRDVGIVNIPGDETPTKISEGPSGVRGSTLLPPMPPIPAVTRQPVSAGPWGPSTGTKSQVFSAGGGSMGGNSGSIFGPAGNKIFGPDTIVVPQGGSRKADNIVFVLDASGSVLESFDKIHDGLLRFFNETDPKQAIHVIFFRGDSLLEAPARRLVQANMENRKILNDFVNSVQPSGHGSSPIPALNAALRALKASSGRGANLVYLLTDGDFDQSSFMYKSGGRNLTGTEAVVAWLHDNNKDGFLHVSPIILGPAPEPRVEQMMRTIAKENGGVYRYVSAN